MKATDIVYKMLDEDEVPPEHYLGGVPPKIDREALLHAIDDSAGWYCFDKPAEKKQFIRWMNKHSHLFPDIVKAAAVVNANNAWCTDNADDMDAFLFELGFPRTDNTCTRCDGTGEEPGAPGDEDHEGNTLYPVCERCRGVGTLPDQTGGRAFQ